jgi:hypothetical protein
MMTPGLSENMEEQTVIRALDNYLGGTVVPTIPLIGPGVAPDIAIYHDTGFKIEGAPAFAKATSISFWIDQTTQDQWIAFGDGNNANWLSVMKYDSTLGWQYVGTPGFSGVQVSGLPSIKTDNLGGYPAVGMIDSLNNVIVYQWDGMTWNIIGGSSIATATIVDVGIDDTSGNIFAVYDDTSLGRGVINKWDGMAWAEVVGFSTSNTVTPDGAQFGEVKIQVFHSGFPVGLLNICVAYSDLNQSGKISCTRWIDDGVSDWQYQGVQTYASFVGQVAGMTTDVTINADVAGTAGNITLNGDGSSTVSDLILAWNTTNPGNTVTLASGDGTQIPDIFTLIKLIGGSDGAGFSAGTASSISLVMVPSMTPGSYDPAVAYADSGITIVSYWDGHNWVPVGTHMVTGFLPQLIYDNSDTNLYLMQGDMTLSTYFIQSHKVNSSSAWVSVKSKVYGGSTPAQFRVDNTTGYLYIANWYAIMGNNLSVYYWDNNDIIIDSGYTIPQVMAKQINILYADLIIAMNASTLIEGMKYRITDYQTTYLLPNTSGSVASGVIESIIVTALSSNTISDVAYSESRPQQRSWRWSKYSRRMDIRWRCNWCSYDFFSLS